MTLGSPYIGTSPTGDPIPPPRTCPDCGQPTRRKHNRQVRWVECKCGWEASISTLTIWHSSFNPKPREAQPCS
jgi:hypothetical protein